MWSTPRPASRYYAMQSRRRQPQISVRPRRCLHGAAPCPRFVAPCCPSQRQAAPLPLFYFCYIFFNFFFKDYYYNFEKEMTSSSNFMTQGGSYTNVLLILLGVSLTHVHSSMLYSILFSHFHILFLCSKQYRKCCLYCHYLGRIKLILILILIPMPGCQP